MVRTFEGDTTLPQGRFAIVAARFNAIVVDALVDGAIQTFARHGIAEDRVDLIRVPGSFELPAAARQLVQSNQYAAVVCLGAVIRGETEHDQHVAGGAASGIATLALESHIPVIFGVLTCETLEQALNRAGGKAGNKGADAALAAIEMASLFHQLQGRAP